LLDEAEASDSRWVSLRSKSGVWTEDDDDDEDEHDMT
jgi:hypothetical protein